ncbi:MAG: hypothetical protein FJ303_03140 [Planctomycetes bacterium]|nr:hypothetical protein [Planctomycetota bacterium]
MAKSTRLEAYSCVFRGQFVLPRSIAPFALSALTESCLPAFTITRHVGFVGKTAIFAILNGPATANFWFNFQHRLFAAFRLLSGFNQCS